MQSTAMKEALTMPYKSGEELGLSGKTKGLNPMKPLFSEIGDVQKTSDKLMFALISIKFPTQYDEDLYVSTSTSICLIGIYSNFLTELSKAIQASS